MKIKLLVFLLFACFKSFIHSQNLPPYVPTNSLIAYYSFTGNSNDISGNGYNGTATGTILTTDRNGNANSAYSFDGVSSYIDVAIATIPQNNSPRTISGWFKTNSPNYTENNYSAIFNYGSLSTSQRFALTIYSKGYLDFITGSDFSNNDPGAQNNYLDNVWHFVTVTYDGTKVSLFIDGIYVTGANITLNTINKTFRIGKRITGDTYNEYFKGSIDDIGIWNRALTPAEISLLYTSEGNNYQFTLIPDSNFENKLIALGIDSGVPDGKVLTADIAFITDLDVSNSNISDLTGIQDFLSLNKLFCGSNQLTSIDVSKNTNLKLLSCGSNQLTNLDISKNIELTYLSCSINKLTNLDVSKNTALTNIFCHTNLLTNLNVSNNPSLIEIVCANNQLKNLNVSMNNSLISFNCAGNQLTNLDISKNSALNTLDCAGNQLTNLDVSRNTALITLSCYSNQLTNLDVKTNTALTKLDAGSNQISTLDVSKNTALTFLGCNTSLLTTLDVNNNTALTLLDCRENKLTSLDVSKITTLIELYCQSNQLTNLDVSKNKALEFLNCSKNQLADLNVNVNTALVGLYCNSNQLTNLNLKNGNNSKLIYLNFTKNPNLSCIRVDDINYSDTNWSTKKDATASYNTNCTPSFAAIPDQNFEQKLIDLGIDTDGLNGKITVANINSITTLDLSNSNIKDLTGIENFTALNILDCSNNQLVSLDLSKNTNLQILYVTGNPLVYLNLKNGNNQNLIVASLTSKKLTSTGGTNFLGITTLGCVKVDNAAYSNANWSKIKEATTVYSETCTLGLEESEFSKAVVYPNPTKGEINILHISLEKATVYNALGQLVKKFNLDSSKTDNKINLSELPKGIYYIYLINQNSASVKKVIVE